MLLKSVQFCNLSNSYIIGEDKYGSLTLSSNMNNLYYIKDLKFIVNYIDIMLGKEEILYLHGFLPPWKESIQIQDNISSLIPLGLSLFNAYITGNKDVKGKFTIKLDSFGYIYLTMSSDIQKIILPNIEYIDITNWQDNKQYIFHDINFTLNDKDKNIDINKYLYELNIDITNMNIYGKINIKTNNNILGIINDCHFSAVPTYKSNNKPIISDLFLKMLGFNNNLNIISNYSSINNINIEFKVN
jgi:hypothetical protein